MQHYLMDGKMTEGVAASRAIAGCCRRPWEEQHSGQDWAVKHTRSLVATRPQGLQHETSARNIFLYNLV